MGIPNEEEEDDDDNEAISKHWALDNRGCTSNMHTKACASCTCTHARVANTFRMSDVRRLTPTKSS